MVGELLYNILRVKIQKSHGDKLELYEICNVNVSLTSSKHRMTFFSFFRIIKSSVSNNKHSKISSPFLAKSMKLETLSRAKKVPGLAPGLNEQSPISTIGTAVLERMDCVRPTDDIVFFSCFLVKYSFA